MFRTVMGMMGFYMALLAIVGIACSCMAIVVKVISLMVSGVIGIYFWGPLLASVLLLVIGISLISRDSSGGGTIVEEGE